MVFMESTWFCTCATFSAVVALSPSEEIRKHVAAENVFLLQTIKSKLRKKASENNLERVYRLRRFP
jgi:hypothetical protein